MTLIVNNQTILTDKLGYLKNSDDWNRQIAEAIAEIEQIELTEAHWEVIHYVRDFYLKFNKSPSMRPLVKFLKAELGAEKGTSIYLASLFPGGAAKQSTKLAGLPKPARCI
ncbi:MAG TPA: TusE/DsrC/DsvC family sulfur relay protein [Aeromonadales bacterium]|nr:TusE/DsrC/DsvC family sulfur relay protein [Aeromonadales bacterium]